MARHVDAHDGHPHALPRPGRGPPDRGAPVRPSAAEPYLGQKRPCGCGVAQPSHQSARPRRTPTDDAGDRMDRAPGHAAGHHSARHRHSGTAAQPQRARDRRRCRDRKACRWTVHHPRPAARGDCGASSRRPPTQSPEGTHPHARDGRLAEGVLAAPLADRLRLPGAGRPPGRLQPARRLHAPPGSRLPGAADRDRVRRRPSPILPRPVRAGHSTQRTVRGGGVGAAARGEEKRSGLVRKTPQALHREAVSVTLNLSPAGGSTMISRPQSQWIHPQETAQRGPTTNAPRGPPKCGAGREESVPDERSRRRTRGTGAGSQIQRAGSTSSKSAYSEYFQVSEYFEACVDPSLEPSLVLPEDCPDEDGAPAPLFFGRTLAGMPTALESAATSLTTTALAPTAELSPTTTGPRIFAPEPMST